MAVFMENICKYNNCGLTFPHLADLIQHIEDTHIDYDPIIIEQKEQQQPACIPLSYVQKFYADVTRKEGSDMKKKLPLKTPSFNTLSNTPTGSEADEDEVMSESEDSNDSWTTPEEFSSEFILRYGSNRVLDPSPTNNNVDKPFACPVPGCKKRYKNVNGIKYHSKNGHKKDGKIRKGFKCHCGKSYKTGQGLKNHTTANHNGVNLATLTTQTGEVIQIPTSRVTSLQPLRAVTLKQISPANFNALGLPLKTIQGIVVATKSTCDNSLKSDGIYDRLTFAKGSTVQMTVPTLVTSAKGILNNLIATKVNADRTVSSALGVLTPATSPQTLPSESGSLKSPPALPIAHISGLPNNVRALDIVAPTAKLVQNATIITGTSRISL